MNLLNANASDSMSEFKSIEDKLSQLIPSAVSDHGLERMDEAIDQLALTSNGGRDTECELPSGKVGKYGWPKMGGVWKSAAILALLIVPAVILNVKTRSTNLNGEVFLASNAIIPENPSGMVVLKTSNWIDSSEDDGLIIPDDGSTPHHRYRLYVIDEDKVRDDKTGIVVTVRGSSHEVVTIPVTEF